uniref:Uncharacterized protein n=1 Tax=Molossus molossus TaxID=27622 RepID=A0A7J8F9H9_MOLMO|nr:hypothetical protein HJG59_008539 [Molossus molossus]
MLPPTPLYRCFNVHIINNKPCQSPAPQTCQPISHSAGPRQVPSMVSPSLAPSPTPEQSSNRGNGTQLSRQPSLQRFRSVMPSANAGDAQKREKPDLAGWARSLPRRRQDVGLLRLGRRLDLRSTLKSRLYLDGWRKGNSMYRAV